MDFGSLLYAAHKNEKSANKEVKCYSTKFEPPKKEVKTKTNLSANIQKYLQKREDDERRKAEEEKKKKEELLELRSKDKKSFKRVQTMLKRTKSANKSVMEDAIDDVNTAVTMAGPQQCDEDDYGYVSQEASAFYAKMMDKYQSTPDEPKFPKSSKPVVKDLNAAKDRVRAALQKEEEEEMMPHKRKRKRKESETHKGEENMGKSEDEGRRRSPLPEEPKPKKPKKMAPPPMDFSALLKLAEKKQFEPVKLEKKVKDDEDNGVRPMTKKEKIEYQREQEWRERKMARENAMKNGPKKIEPLNRIPKIASNNNNSEEERKEKPNTFGRIPKKISTEIRPEADRKNEIRKPPTTGRPYSDSSKSSSLTKNEQSRSNNSFDISRKVGRSSYEEDSRCGRSNEISSQQLAKVNSSLGRSSSSSYDRQRTAHQSKDSCSAVKDRKTSESSRTREGNISDDERYGSPSEKRSSSYQSNERQNYSKTAKTPSHYEREREKSRMPAERSIAENRVTSRKHSISDDEQSNSSELENQRSDGSERSFKSERQSSSHDRERDRNKSYHRPDESERNFKSERQLSNYDRGRERDKNNHRSEESERNLKSEKHSFSHERGRERDNSNHRSGETERKHKTEKQSSSHDRGRERDRRNYGAKETHSRNREQKPFRSSSSDNSPSNKYRSKNHSVSEVDSDTSDIENRQEPQRKYSMSDKKDYSPKPSFKNKTTNNHTEKKIGNSTNSLRPGREHQHYSTKRKYSDSSTQERRTEKERSSYPQPKKPRESSSRDRSSERHRKRSPSPQAARYKVREEEYSDSEQEDNGKYVPRMAPSKKIEKSKEKKIASLFEGSDDETDKKHSKPSYDSASQRSNESKFKTPKLVPKHEVERSSSSERSDKYRVVEKERLSNVPTNKPGPKCSKTGIHPSGPKTPVEKPRPSSSDKPRPSADKPRLSNDKPRPPGEPVRKPSSSESSKKPELFNPEAVLKKSSDVWSKPCNLPPSPSTARSSSGLSESQIQRLREMNKKPTPAKPPGDRLRTALERPASREERKPEARPVSTRPGEKVRSSSPVQSRTSSQSSTADRTKPSSDRSSLKPSSSSSSPLKPRDAPKDSRSRQFPPSDLRPKQFPPSDLKPRQFPPKDVRGRQFPPADVKRRPKPRRIESDSEDEEDSEMDDFIEDGTDMDQEQILEEIRNIFGYDKSKYAGMDDDEVEESNFGRIDQEELHSLRIGLVEDYEDMKMEELEKKRKMQRKLAAMKNRRW